MDAGPFRTPGKPFVEPPKCDEAGCTMPLCECGHKHDTHYWFNSEFIDCGGLGYYNDSIIGGVKVTHQRKAFCGCQRYRGTK